MQDHCGPGSILPGFCCNGAGGEVQKEQTNSEQRTNMLFDGHTPKAVYSTLLSSRNYLPFLVKDLIIGVTRSVPNQASAWRNGPIRLRQRGTVLFLFRPAGGERLFRIRNRVTCDRKSWLGRFRLHCNHSGGGIDQE
jgi:hypothetical protein